MHPKNWMEVRPEGLYCKPGDFYIDPVRPVASAVITHGHADHARSGHERVLATMATLGIMRERYGQECAKSLEELSYHKEIIHNGVKIKFLPAGHILGSAQAVLEHNGGKIIISGDYKRAWDPTCALFQPENCDVFVTEATFGLPVFTHPPVKEELKRLLSSLKDFPERAHLVGAYALGKCQRIIMELRELGYNEPIYLHGSAVKLCRLYQEHGLNLGELIPVSEIKDKKEYSQFAGQVILCPPSALADRWSQKFPDPVRIFASGWMRVRARAKQKLIEMPLVVSDHADWPELIETIKQVAAPEVWVTHGAEEALIYWCNQNGYRAKALSLLGYEDEMND